MKEGLVVNVEFKRMGQEQSTSRASPSGQPRARSGVADGVTLVEGSGSGLRSQTTTSEANKLLQQSSSLALPQPLLPPPPVEDNISSALQGAQMMHELRTLLDGLLLSESEQASTSETLKNTNSSEEPQSQSQAQIQQSTARDSQAKAAKGRAASSEQDAWSQFGIDAHVVEQVIADCTGGERMCDLVTRQKHLLEKVRQMAGLAMRLKAAVDMKNDQARKTSKAIEKLDRLSMSISDVQDTLEQVVATANILGAAHFGDDEEMRSFKTFLKHHPADC